MQQTNLKGCRMRFVIDHILIGLVIIFGTVAVSQIKPDMIKLDKIQLLFLCKDQ